MGFEHSQAPGVGVSRMMRPEREREVEGGELDS